MNRTTTAAGVAALGLSTALLGSVLAGVWADTRDGSGATHLGRTASGPALLPLRREDAPVTIEARPRPERSARTVAVAAPDRSVPASRAGELAPAAQRDAELAAWLATALPVDPSADLVADPYAGTPADPLADPAPGTTGQPLAPTPDPTTTGGVSASFTLGSFNVLGSSHTRGGARGKASGVTRVGGVVQLLAQHAFDVVGFQELQSDQLRELQRQQPDWQFFPGTALSAREAENSLGWDARVWDRVSTTTVAVPYFDGHVRRMPVVVLRHKASGIRATFVNVHNPADTRRYRGQQRWRDQATDVEVGLVNQLAATGTPVFLTGDMNERDEYFCAITGRTTLRAARGGSNGLGGCDAGRPRAVDWVFGSPGVRFSDYTEDRSPLVDRTTDHPVIATRATVDTATFPAAG